MFVVPPLVPRHSQTMGLHTHARFSTPPNTVLNTGRINVAGLNEAVIEYVASSMHACVTGAAGGAAAAAPAAAGGAGGK